MDFLFNRSSCKIQNETSPAEAAVSSSPEFSLWQDKYQPTNAKDVAAHTSKVSVEISCFPPALVHFVIGHWCAILEKGCS